MRARRIGAVLALAAGSVLLAAGPASAAETPASARASAPAVSIVAAPWDDKCKTAPDVDAPVMGALGTATPATVQGNDVSMFQQYGFSGLRWFTYDLGSSNLAGCLPSGESIGAATSTTTGNYLLMASKGIVLLDDMLLRRAYTSDWMGIFDPFVGRAVTSVHDAVFNPWSAVALTLLGLLILMKAYRGSLATATTRAATAVVVLVAAFLVASQPVVLIHDFYNSMDQATVEITSDITNQKAADGSAPGPADAMIATMHKTILYRVWLEGELGDADSATAQKYGPQLLAATAMTYDEMKQRGTPAFSKLVDKKQKDFLDLADKIQTEDPVAYTYLQGKHSEDRTSKAARSLIATFASSPVLIAGAMAMMMSKLIALFAIVMSMIVLVAALVRGSVGVNLLDRVLSGAATALVWCAALPLSMLLTDAALINPHLDSISSTIIILAVNAAIFFGAKSIAPGFHGVLRRKHARRGMQWGRFVTQAVAGFAGARAGAAAGQATAQQGGGAEVVDATIDPDPAEPSVEHYGEAWNDDASTVGPKPTARALPTAPVTPDDVTKPSDAADRGLPDEPTAPETPKPGGRTYRPVRREGDSDVYDIYSGNQRPTTESEPRTDEDRAEIGADDRDSDSPLAIEGSE